MTHTHTMLHALQQTCTTKRVQHLKDHKTSKITRQYNIIKILEFMLRKISLNKYTLQFYNVNGQVLNWVFQNQDLHKFA